MGGQFADYGPCGGAALDGVGLGRFAAADMHLRQFLQSDGVVGDIGLVGEKEFLAGLLVKVPAADVGIPAVFQWPARKTVLLHSGGQGGDAVVPQLFQGLGGLGGVGGGQLRAKAHASGNGSKIKAVIGGKTVGVALCFVRPEKGVAVKIPRISVNIHRFRLARSVKAAAIGAKTVIEGVVQKISGGVFVADFLLAVGSVADEGNAIALRRGLGVNGFPAIVGSRILGKVNGIIRSQVIRGFAEGLSGGGAFRHGEDIRVFVHGGEAGVKALPGVFPEQNPQAAAGGHHSGGILPHSLVRPDEGIVGRVGNGVAQVIGRRNHIGDCFAFAAIVNDHNVRGKGNTIYRVAVGKLLGVVGGPDGTIFAQKAQGKRLAEGHAVRHGL